MERTISNLNLIEDLLLNLHNEGPLRYLLLFCFYWLHCVLDFAMFLILKLQLFVQLSFEFDGTILF